uniref:Sarcosine dehydrogenase, mitochondrial n=1 Tax=Petromyzon marinus TaxID=7757 RepID=A0AAJ7U6C3_PETMA|nr:sarcosine dehydrogenase, mitochondrial [Petromyzon marinus]XP_032829114.1 sarcosine dehydrogenase, mitochondrial [Petromyzon marinus]XP_032829116.1 sarcosine dehydrogenase, mitochondrial [Petromyzon marinus]XP_032829117.1 sarcosine dehydrogenase, mitochondrial [Petromyzon marinus]
MAQVCRILSRGRGSLSRGTRGLSTAASSASSSSSSPPSAGKAVPYAKTLKEDGGGAKDPGAPSKALPRHTSVVVVGGGSLGCQTLYHLAKAGVTDAVLLERDRLTAGTTWHTAGLLWQLRPSDTEVELLRHTRRVVSEDLERETGLHTGWIQNGGLFIASNRQRLDEYKRLMSLGKAYGIESHVLSPADTKVLYPLMNVDDLYGTLYVPGDGTMDPAGTCSTLARAATARGAQVIENCAVTGVRVEEDDMGVARVRAVETQHGVIHTPCVVNCAGVWARKLGRMAGVNVPLCAMHHAYVVTERIEGIQNMPNVRDHDASVYLRLQGDALSVGGYEANPVFWEEVSDSFAFGLFDLDWDVFAQHIEGAVNRVPTLANTGIKSTVCGPESFTADHKPLLGESPEVRGFFLGCGFNSAGMMLGGGCGQELAHWIIHGRPEKDMFSYDIRRFHGSMTNNNRWIRERSHESYAKNYSVVFPHDEPLASRNVRLDPFHKVLQQQGCVFQERHGWERPGWFNLEGAAAVLPYDYYGSYDHKPHQDYKYKSLLSDEYTFDFPPHHHVIRDECVSCRNAVAVFSMSYFGKFYLVGPDAKKAADWLFTADVSKPVGATVYTCLLNPRGGVEGDLTVSRVAPGKGDDPLAPEFEGDGFYLAVGGASAQHAWSHVSSVLQDGAFRCRLVDTSPRLGLLSVQGPRSREVLEKVLDADLSNESFPFSTHKLVKAAGHEVRAMRVSFVGELGWELHVPAAACDAVYAAVMEAGRPLGIANAGYRAIDSLSIEKGYRHWHADLRTDDSPLEAGLAFTCKLKSSVPFLGREALEEERRRGLAKRIACFTIDERVPLLGLEAIWRDGCAVGHVRRADFGFHIERSLAYGYVRDPAGISVTTDFLRNGDYAIERMGVKYPAKLHLKSPFDPENKRVRGNYE